MESNGEKRCWNCGGLLYWPDYLEHMGQKDCIRTISDRLDALIAELQERNDKGGVHPPPLIVF